MASEDAQAEYEQAKQETCEALIRWLQAGDRLGKPQQMMAAEFMGTFAEAANRAFDGEGTAA